jgi:medium-chain acyl-[acyl-carrier-protein] hydrolase
MVGNTYKKEFEVRYSEVDNKQKITLVSLLKYMEEVAIGHSESIGFGINKLKDLGLAWILNKWNVEIDRYPSLDERIVLETWSSGFDKFYGTREFCIRDVEGNIICRASSLWILLNIERRRPARITEDIEIAYRSSFQRIMEIENYDFKQVENYEDKREFDVRRRDIDTNNHVNNAVYVEWIVEAISEEIYENYLLVKLEIVYKKETAYGSSINVNSQAINKRDDLIEYLHSIDGKETGMNLVLGRSIWKRNI